MHSLSSCKSKTPLQLYTEGMITLQHHSIPSLDYFEPVQESVYGVDQITLLSKLLRKDWLYVRNLSDFII